MFADQLTILPIEDRLAIHLATPREALAHLMRMCAKALSEQVADLPYTDKDTLQLLYVKVRSQQQLLGELETFLLTLSSTIPGEAP